MPSGRTKALRSAFNPLAPLPATNPLSSPYTPGPAAGGGIPAYSGSVATAGSGDGSYIGTDGKARNADGSRKVGGATLAARSQGWWSGLSTGAKIAIIGGGVALVVVYIAYRKATAPLRYANKIAGAVKNVHAAVTGG